MKKLLGLAVILALVIFAFQFVSIKPKNAIPKQQNPPKVVQKTPLKQKYISLTFDDGPDPVYTPKILGVLKKHHAFATFFFLGNNIKNNPGLVGNVLTDGCEIGVHSYDHVPLTNLTEVQVQSQINKTYQLVYNITGYKPVLFRPPFGFINRKVLSAAKKKGLKVVLWSRRADPKDFTNPGADKIATRVLDRVESGTIVLLHDRGGDRMETVEAVDKIITQLSSKGYSFVTVSTLLKDPSFQDIIRK